MSTSGPLLTFAGVLGAAFLSMGAYALAGRRTDRDAERRGAQFLMGAGNFLIHWFLWLLSPLERAAARLGLGPDVLNVAGLLLGAASAVLIAMGELERGGWMLLAGGVCDILDGRIARARGVVSDYGKFIDSTLDRFVESFAFVGFAVFLRPFSWGPSLATAALAGSLLVSYTRARGEAVGVVCHAGLMQRAERLALMCISCLADAAVSSSLAVPRGTAVLWAVGAIAAGTAVTAVYRTVWIARELKRAGRG